MFLRNANPGAAESELLARDKLAHALMYLSRGNPVVYYGDEQGFTGAGGDQDARQDMFPSQSPQYNNLTDPIEGDDGAGKNDNIGSDETPMDDNFDPGHMLYRELAGLAAVTKRHPALRDGAQQHRFSSVVGGRLRVLAHRPLAQARVRRRAQQRGAARVGVRADVRARQQVGEGLGQRRAAAAHGRRPGARRLARPAVGGRLPLPEAHPAQPPGAVGRRRASRRRAPTASRCRRRRRRQLASTR